MPNCASETIAIVGCSCRFPGGASTPSKLWELLKDPQDILKEIPATRFNYNGFYHVDGEHHGVSSSDTFPLAHGWQVQARDLMPIEPQLLL
jgi:acyl transferase domain-containing protein